MHGHLNAIYKFRNMEECRCCNYECANDKLCALGWLVAYCRLQCVE